MGRLLSAVLVLWGAGCAQLFGIAETTGAPPDAPTPQVSLAFERVSIGASVVTGPIDLTGQSASFLVPDPADPTLLTRVPGVLAPSNDTWTADLPDGTPSVEFTLPDQTSPYRRLYALGVRDTKGLFGAYEHPGANDPAPAGGSFATTFTLPTPYAAGESIQLFAVGTWGRHALGAGELPPVNTTTFGPVNIPYTDAVFSTATGLPLSTLTAADQLVALRYVGSDLTGSAIVTKFDQSGGSDPVSVSLAANSQAPLAVQVQPAMVGPRLNGTRPAVAQLSMSWSVVAAPAWQLSNNTGPLLEAGTVLATDSGAIATPYGNPFTSLGWSSLFTWATSQSRTYTPPAMMLPMTLFAGLIEQAEPTAGLTLDLPAGLPVLISIDQLPLNTDGMTVTIDPTKSVELGLVADRTPNTFYQWNLYELVPNAPFNTALTYAIRYSALSTATTVRVPGDVFTAGKLYTIRGHCMKGGYPQIAIGDLQPRDLPFAFGYLDSGVFTVVGP